MGVYWYGASFHDSELNVLTNILGTNPKTSLCAYLKLGEKKQPTVNEIEIPELLWLRIEKEVKRLIEVGILEWINNIKPENSSVNHFPGGPKGHTLQ